LWRFAGANETETIRVLVFSFFTEYYGLASDYLADAFHHMLPKVNLATDIRKKLKFNEILDSRDKIAVIKTVSAFCKMLHLGAEPTSEEIDEYTCYAIESRRRLKDQLNKRKKDGEFGNINLGYINSAGIETIVHCPESTDH
jgi:ATP-dependent Lon protease